jgi:hypothetical protein
MASRGLQPCGRVVEYQPFRLRQLTFAVLSCRGQCPFLEDGIGLSVTKVNGCL